MRAVILAAGDGKRLMPLTESIPKAMLQIANKPLIDYHLGVLKRLGIDDVAVVVGHEKEKIIKHEKNAKFFEQKKQLGTADALYVARNFVNGKFLLIYGDIFFTDPLKRMIRSEKPTMAVFKARDASRFGKVEVKNGNLFRICEKSEKGEGLINAGIYSLHQDIFDKIEETNLSNRKEYELTDSIMKLREVEVYRLDGYWNDIGYPRDYMDANMFMLKKINFFVGRNTKIWKNATIRKPVLIGKNCEIKNCVIENSVIGNNCVVGEFSILKRSILMNRTNIPHLNYVADSIIGEDCNLGAGTIIANKRFDKSDVRINIKGKRIDSGMKKFGAIIGDNVKTGINVSIYPGKKIGSNCLIDANILVRKDVKRNSYIKLEQRTERKRLK